METADGDPVLFELVSRFLLDRILALARGSRAPGRLVSLVGTPILRWGDPRLEIYHVGCRNS